MTVLNAVWQNGQVVLKGLADWPEGRRLIVQEEMIQPIEFMTEEEMSDDPQAIRQWIDELQTIGPVPDMQENPDDSPAWQEAMRQFNLEAVRKQFEEGFR